MPPAQQFVCCTLHDMAAARRGRRRDGFSHVVSAHSSSCTCATASVGTAPFGAEATLVRPGLVEILATLPDSALAADRIMRAPLPEEGRRSAADLLAAGETARAAHYARTAGGDR